MQRWMIAFALLAAAPAAAETPQRAIMAAMTASAKAWDAGDLPAFVAVYAPDAIYAAGADVVRGKDAIARRYAKSFVPGRNTRGRLSFAPLAWRALGTGRMLLVARWTLRKPQGAADTGLTSLVFERRGAAWRILADHSS
jgi:uncharacterized protein (TIGR02246 family)